MRHDRLRDRAHLRPRGARVAAAGDRVGPLPRSRSRPRSARACSSGSAEVEGFEQYLRRVVPRPEAVLARGARRADADARRGDRARRRGRRARGRDRHGAPRPPERARRTRSAARTSRSCASSRASARSTRSSSTPRAARGDVKYHLRRRARARRAAGEIDGHARAEPEPPRGGRPGRRGLDARRADRPLERRRRCTTRSSRSPILIHGDASFPGQGVVAETLNLAEPRRLLDRRHAAPDREQPGRLHDRPERGPLDALLERPRQGLRHPDRPRQRRRPRGGDLGAIRLALAYRAEFGHDVVIDLVGYRRFGHNEQDEAAYTQPLMVERIDAPADRRASSTPRGSSRRASSPQEEADALVEAMQASAARGARAAARRRSAEPPRRRRSRRIAAAAPATPSTRPSPPSGSATLNEQLLARAGGLHRPPEARAAARAPPRRARARAGSTGARPRRSRSRRCSSTASRSG